MVTEDDFDELYTKLKGARYAGEVLDAKTFLQQQDYAAAVKLLEAIRADPTMGEDRRPAP